jgi:hypothetical protein
MVSPRHGILDINALLMLRQFSQIIEYNIFFISNLQCFILYNNNDKISKDICTFCNLTLHYTLADVPKIFCVTKCFCSNL